MSIRARVLCGAVMLVAAVAVLDAPVLADEIGPGTNDWNRCKNVVAVLSGTTMQPASACYYDPLHWASMDPGVYTDVADVSYGVWSGTGGVGTHFTLCGNMFDTVESTVYVGPIGHQAVLGRELLAGQVIAIAEDLVNGDCGSFDVDVTDPPAGCQPIGAGGSSGHINAPAAGLSAQAHSCGGTPFELEWYGGVDYESDDEWVQDWIFSNAAWPEDWFPGNIPGNETPPGLCGDINARMWINGEAFADAGGQVVLPTDDVSVELDVSETGAELEDFFLAVRARPADDYTTISGGAIAADSPIPEPTFHDPYWRFNVSALFDSGVADLTTFEVQCQPLAGGPIVYWSPNSTLCADVQIWCFNANINRACLALTILYPPKATVQVADELRFGYVMQPGPFFGEDPGVSQLQALRQGSDEEFEVEEAFDAGGDQNGGIPFTALFLAGESGYFMVVSAWDTNSEFIYFRCTDSQGVILFDPSGRPQFDGGCVPHDCGADAESCFASSGIGLAPSSWVPGAGRMMLCIFKAAVIPRTGFVGDWATDTRQTLEDVPPFSFGLAVIEFGSTLVDEVENPSGTGCTNIGIPIAGDSTHAACVSADGVETTSPQRAVIALFVLVPLYLGLLGRGFELLRAK